MHTRGSSLGESLPIDLEIETTTRRQSGRRRREESKENMADEQQQPLLFHECGMPDANGVLSSIVRQNVAATHFELKP
ncbi:Guanine nucleotide exchange factor SPIKE 1 [Bienertia sinuspersici]